MRLYGRLGFLPLVATLLSFCATAFQAQSSSSRLPVHMNGEKTNKAMEFLKRIGKVGGSANKEYIFAMGVDEGPSGKALGSRGSVSTRSYCSRVCASLSSPHGPHGGSKSGSFGTSHLRTRRSLWNLAASNGQGRLQTMRGVWMHRRYNSVFPHNLMWHRMDGLY
jgi:hypothetical protein